VSSIFVRVIIPASLLHNGFNFGNCFRYIWPAAKALATPINTIHVSDQGHFGKTRLSAKKEGVAALGYVIPARDLEDVVAQLIS
jgi:2-polyprenyl-6-methoxyphenol hydroxylase-like FAD-dependent oxidoreductase